MSKNNNRQLTKAYLLLGKFLVATTVCPSNHQHSPHPLKVRTQKKKRHRHQNPFIKSHWNGCASSREKSQFCHTFDATARACLVVKRVYNKTSLKTRIRSENQEYMTLSMGAGNRCCKFTLGARKRQTP